MFKEYAPEQWSEEMQPHYFLKTNLRWLLIDRFGDGTKTAEP
jgi:hypothetical protein